MTFHFSLRYPERAATKLYVKQCVRRRVMKHLIPLLVVLLLSPVVIAGDCKPANVNVGANVYYFDSPYPPECTFQGVDYLWCLEAPAIGTLNGTWWYFASVWDNFVEVLDPMPGHPGFWAYYAVSYVSTSRGELWMRNTGVMDLENYFGDFPFGAETMAIVGGTDDYEGATGWLGYIWSEEGGVMKGEVCTQ